MARAAYRPTQTQTPYVGGSFRFGFAGMQADTILADYDTVRERREEPPIAPVLEHLPERTAFKAHYAQWLEDSLFDSLPDRMRRHESYQAIVEQGDRVVPLIAAELRRDPSFLFLALEDITQQDPVPEAAQGNLNATVAAWLSWLRK